MSATVPKTRHFLHKQAPVLVPIPSRVLPFVVCSRPAMVVRSSLNPVYNTFFFPFSFFFIFLFFVFFWGKMIHSKPAHSTQPASQPASQPRCTRCAPRMPVIISDATCSFRVEISLLLPSYIIIRAVLLSAYHMLRAAEPDKSGVEKQKRHNLVWCLIPTCYPTCICTMQIKGIIIRGALSITKVIIIHRHRTQPRLPQRGDFSWSLRRAKYTHTHTHTHTYIRLLINHNNHHCMVVSIYM